MCESIITGEYESCTYNVFEMYEGAVGEEYTTCDFEDAYQEFQRLSADAENSGSSGSTIHLYDTFSGTLIADHYIN